MSDLTITVVAVVAYLFVAWVVGTAITWDDAKQVAAGDATRAWFDESVPSNYGIALMWPLGLIVLLLYGPIWLGSKIGEQPLRAKVKAESKAEEHQRLTARIQELEREEGIT